MTIQVLKRQSLKADAASSDGQQRDPYPSKADSRGKLPECPPLSFPIVTLELSFS